MKPIVFITCLFCHFSLFSQSELRLQKFNKKDLDSSIQALISFYNITDASIRANKNGKTIFSFNQKEENKNKNYLIGSCSKSFTALASLILVDRGEIKLDKKVKDYLPWFRLKGNAASKITVRHLLNQTSGLGTSDGQFDLLTDNNELYKKGFSAYLEKVLIRSEPGQKFIYCNSNFILLGLIIEEVSRKPFASFVKENIFIPNGMTNSYATYKATLNQNVISGKQDWYHIFQTSSKFEYSDFFVPTGLISSTTEDIQKYLYCILNNAITAQNDTLLTKESYYLLTSASKGGYAMGWMNETISYNKAFKAKHDIPFIFHLGSLYNYVSCLAIYPEKEITISILATGNSFEFSQMVMNTILTYVDQVNYKREISKERIYKSALLFLVLIICTSFSINLRRLARNNFNLSLKTSLKKVLRLVIGLVLSLGITLSISPLFQIPLKTMVFYLPDLSLCILLISGIGSISSFIRYLGRDHKESA